MKPKIQPPIRIPPVSANFSQTSEPLPTLSWMHRIYFSPDHFLSKFLTGILGYRFQKVSLPLGDIAFYEYPGNPGAKTIVLIHGIGVGAVHYYELLIRFQRRGYRVLALDLPSHGLSSDLAQGTLTARHLYQSVCDWMNFHAVPSFTLIGNSLGGLLALKYAFFHPDRVSHLVVNSPAGGFEEPSEWLELKRKLLLHSLEETALFLKKVYARPPFYLPLMTLFFHLNMHRLGVVELLQSAELKDFQPLRTPKAQNLPILFMWGRQEQLFSPRSLSWFQKKLTGPVVWSFPEGLGHCAHMECPSLLVQEIESLWRQFPHP